MPVGDQDGGSVPMALAVVLGGLDKFLDFPLGQILTRPTRASNCYIYTRRSRHFEYRVFHCFSPIEQAYCYISCQKCNSSQASASESSTKRPVLAKKARQPAQCVGTSAHYAWREKRKQQPPKQRLKIFSPYCLL